MEQVIFQQCWKGLNFTKKKSTFLKTDKYQKKKKYIFTNKKSITNLQKKSTFFVKLKTLQHCLKKKKKKTCSNANANKMK